MSLEIRSIKKSTRVVLFKKQQLRNSRQFGNQLVDYIISVLLPYDPLDEDDYEHRRSGTEEILSLLMKYTDLLNKKTVSSFGKRLKSAKVDLMKAPGKRVSIGDNQKGQMRNLYVMKEKYLGKLKKKIANT